MVKKFKVFIQGKNYLLKQQNEITRKYGFYVTVFTEARNPEEAEARAVDMLKNDSRIFDVCENNRSDPPSLMIESIQEIDSFEGYNLPRTGLALYVEE